MPNQNISVSYQQWQREIEAAVNESDSTKLLTRVHIAEAAIFNRLQELAKKTDDASVRAERKAITEAIRTLLTLKRDRLGFPDWKHES